MAFTLLDESTKKDFPSKNERDTKGLSSTNDKSNAPQEEEEWTDEEWVPPQQEGWGEWALRQGARGTARAGEAVLGLPGDISQGILTLSKALPFETGGEGFGTKLLEMIPTSQTIHDYITKPIEKFLPEGYLEPQNDTEKFIDDFTGDLATFLIPFKGKVPFKGALKSAAKLAGAGNLASFLGKQLGAGEGTQSGLKIGSMLLTGLTSPINARKLASNMYKDAESALPAGATLDSSKLSNELRDLRRIVEIGDKTPTKIFMRTRINNLQDAMSGNKMPVREAQAFKRDMNEFIRSFETPQSARKFLPKISHDINEALLDYGKTNPQFLKNYKGAEDLYKAMHYHSKLHGIIKKGKGLKDLNPITAAILGGVGYAFPKGAAAFVGAGFAEKGIAMLAKSPELRKEYAKLIQSAAKSSTPVIAKNIKNFNSEVEKDSFSMPENGEETPRTGFTLLD